MPLLDYSTEFNESLNRTTSLLMGSNPFSVAELLDNLEEIPAEMIGGGVIGAFSESAGVEFKTDKAGAVTYFQSRDFATGSTGWALDSSGDIEASSGTFRGDLNSGTVTGGTVTGSSIKTAATGNRIELDNTNYFLVYSVGGYYVMQINGDGQIRFYAVGAGNDDIAQIAAQAGSQNGEIVFTVGMGSGGSPQTITFNTAAITASGGLDLGSSGVPFQSCYLSSNLDVDGSVITDAFRLDQNPVNAGTTPTHYFVISLNGTDYRVPCQAD